MKVMIQGQDISIFCKVMNVQRDVLPPREWTTINVPRRHGAYLASKNVDARIFEVEVLFRGDVQSQRRAMAALVESDKPISIEFGDRPGIKYFGVLTGETPLEIELHTARTVFSFLIPDPYGQGQTKMVRLPSNGVIDIEGDAEVHPIFLVDFHDPSTFFSIMNQDEQYIQIGQSADVEQKVIEREELVFWDELGSMTGWATWGGAVDGGDIAGTMASNGNAFYALNTGEGNFWHGPAVVKSLDEPVQDFVVEMQATMLSTSSDQMARVELYLLGQNGETVGKLIIRDSDPWTYTNYGFARLGQGENMKYIIDNKTKRLNGFSRDKLRLRREGDLIRAHIGRYDGNKLLWSTGGTFYDTRKEYQQPIAAVAIAIGQRYGAPMSTARADDLKVWRINEVPPVTHVNRLFTQGDYLELNAASGVVLKNAQNIVSQVHPQSDFFTLKPGANVLATAAEGATEVTVMYTSRWN